MTITIKFLLRYVYTYVLYYYIYIYTLYIIILYTWGEKTTQREKVRGKQKLAGSWATPEKYSCRLGSYLGLNITHIGHHHIYLHVYTYMMCVCIYIYIHICRCIATSVALCMHIPCGQTKKRLRPPRLVTFKAIFSQPKEGGPAQCSQRGPAADPCHLKPAEATEMGSFGCAMCNTGITES